MDDNLLDNYINQLKNHYYDLYIIILIVHKDKFKRIILLSNIFIELNTIINKITDKMIGFIRLMWWREALTDLKKGKIKNHPLIENLVNISNTEFENFIEIIESIEAQLEDDQNFENNIEKRYKNFLKILSVEDNNLAILYFITVDVLAKKNMFYFNKIDFYLVKNEQGNKYTEKLIEMMIKNLPSKSQDLTNYLIVESLSFYFKKFKKVNFDIYRFELKKANLFLTINLYFKSIIFRFRIINNKF